ncbi:MAG TPA: nuclear transport factor 2 family protein [Steroidobacteraceae bacterium]|nr:nuclear transport factor 2 family protein [Steroidobacteraceae bacterium]
MKTDSRSCKSAAAGAALVWLALSVGAWAQADSNAPTPPAAATVASSDTAAVHDELRRLREELLAAWQRRDIDGVLAHVDPNIVVTWQNGEVSRGPDAIRRFYKEMLEGEGSVLSNLVSTLSVDDLSILHGPDTAIAFGSIHDEFTFKRALASTAAIGAGNTLALTSRWTATLVRKAGEWKLASYHVSANVFSNPVQDLAVKAAGRVGALVGLVIGALIALLVGWALRRRATTPAA